MKKNTFYSIVLWTVILQMPLYAESYLGNMQRNAVRGFKNIIGAPLEIPITIQEHHESAGYPVIRQTEGLFAGGFRMLKRFGSGVWDYAVLWIPGDQDGVPPKPETLF